MLRIVGNLGAYCKHNRNTGKHIRWIFGKFLEAFWQIFEHIWLRPSRELSDKKLQNKLLVVMANYNI